MIPPHPGDFLNFSSSVMFVSLALTLAPDF